jgi:Zn-dependent protease with chaperone function
MNGLFFELGRRLGRATIPTVQKGRWLWRSLTGSEPEAVQAEAQLGAALAAELRLRWPLGGLPADREQTRDLCRRLSSCVRGPRQTFQADVVETGAPTALALPGGFIFVDVALCELCDRQPDELAFVLGHEMAHVIRRDAVERVLTGLGVDVLTSLMRRGGLKSWVSQTGLRLFQSAYSRANELAADALGARLAQAAGFDPAGATRLLERFARQRTAGGSVGEYFSSHPSEAERIAHLKNASARADA